MSINTAPVEIKVVRDTRSITFKIDLQNSLYYLKYKIFKETNIHPTNQILKFANNPLVNDVENLKSYGIKEGSIL